MAAVYVAAVVLGLKAAALWPQAHPVVFALVADVVATLVVYAFSAWYRNASVYDPYWSVIPILIVLLWTLGPDAASYVPARQLAVAFLVCVWGLRLTWNWGLRWRGLGDEDWRYRMLRARHGRQFWIVNLAGVHLLPTLLVFGGLLAVWPALADSERNLNAWDALAFLVTAGAIAIEWQADRELRRHRASRRGALLRSGWWGRCRHPNYLGEIGFWWGLYLFALAANPGWWWTGIGALAIHLLFLFISIPMMDERLKSRHPDDWEALRALPALLPRRSRATAGTPPPS